MDRRTTLKNLLAGAAGAALLANTTGCEAPAGAPEKTTPPGEGYGLRFPHEIKHDQRIAADSFFTDAEKKDLGILADIITPGTETEPKATDTGVVDFMEFMALDQPEYQQEILRGGVGWLNIEASTRFSGRYFADLTPAERIEIVEDIAYPEDAEGTRFEPGARFFDRVRFLTLTGYFTSKKGMKTIDYQGNAANVWDGVPQEVLDKHGLAYDPNIKYVDQSRRDIVAEWDDEMNLIT